MHSEARERIDAAAQRHEEAVAALYRSDGSQVYSDSEHAAREAELRRQFDAELVAIEGSIEEHIARAEEELLRLDHGDPAAALSTEELQRASALTTFVSDAVYRIEDHDALANRTRAVIASGDRTAMFLYAHHLRAKASDTTFASEHDHLRLRALASELDRALSPERAESRGRSNPWMMRAASRSTPITAATVRATR
jgi:hypothetical protein